MLLSISSFAFDFELSSAVQRPATNEVYIGGTFNTIIVFDISTGKTLRTFEITDGINDLQFNADGSVLIAASAGKALLINPDKGTITASVNGTAFQLFAESPYFVDLRKYGDTKAIIYNSTTGEKVKEVRCDFQPKVCGFDKDFKSIVIVSAKASIDPADEKKNLFQKIEKSTSYNCYNSAYVAKQEDKNGAMVIRFDLIKNEFTANYVCPFDFTGSFALSVIPFKDDIYICDWDMLIKIDKNGISKAIESENPGFAYAIHYTKVMNNIVIASTKSGNLYNPNFGTWTTYDLRQSGEFAYTADIFSTDNKIWLLSKDYTLASMNFAGQKTEAFKINEGSEKGFSVYYHNGFSVKEDRDKEAGIINAELKILNMNSVDLEKFIGQSDVVLATFKTVTEAEAFIKTLKDNKLQYITKIAPAK